MSLEDRMTSLTSAIEKQTQILERLLAGQEKAIGLAEGGKAAVTASAGSKPPTKAEQKALDAAAAKLAKAEAAKNAEAAKPATVAANTTDKPSELANTLQTCAKAWVSRADSDAEKKTRTNFITEIAQASGKYTDGALPYIAGPKCLLDDEDYTKAIFYIKRANKLGLEAVDLTAEYDFGGPVDQTLESDDNTAADEEFDPLA